MIVSARLCGDVCKVIEFVEPSLGPLSEGDMQQIEVMLQAFMVYKDRQARYKDLWAEAGARDNAHHAKSKALRVDAELRGMADSPPDLDDCLDGINYFAFTVRNVRAGRIDHVEG